MCGPPISQSAWIVRRRVKSSRYSSGIFPKSFGSMRSVNCATEPASFLCPLAAELPVLRALHERSVEHLGDVHGLDLLVDLTEDLDRVLELVDLGVQVRDGHLVHEEVVCVVQSVLVVELEIFPEHRDRTRLVALHLQPV